MTALLIILIVILGIIGFEIGAANEGIRHILDHIHEHEHPADIHYTNDQEDS